MLFQHTHKKIFRAFVNTIFYISIRVIIPDILLSLIQILCYKKRLINSEQNLIRVTKLFCHG